MELGVGGKKNGCRLVSLHCF